MNPRVSIKGILLLGLMWCPLTVLGKATSAARQALEKAQEKILEHDRKGAVTILIDSARVEKKESGSYKEIQKLLESASEIFFTEKTQQTFELARSVALSDPPSSISHFREALKAEPDNHLIIKALARALLGMGECEQVLGLSEEGLKIFPVSRELSLLKAQALACLKKPEELREFLKLTEATAGAFQMYLDLAQAQAYFFEDKVDLALGSAQKAKTIDPSFPESYYWLSQISEKSGKADLAYARVYVQLCKELTPKMRRKYEAEPRTCLESKKIQNRMENAPQPPPPKGAPKTPPA